MKSITVATLEPHHCRWPIGDPRHGPFAFCGAEREATGPYCTAHRQRAHLPRETIEATASSERESV